MSPLPCVCPLGLNESSPVCVSSRFVYVWDTTSRRTLYKLPGHAGAVNEVAFHPEEPIGKTSVPWALWGAPRGPIPYEC